MFQCPGDPEGRAENKSDEVDESSDDQPSASTLTDIQHVGESHAENLRAAGYESVAEVAAADTNVLAEMDGIGETRASQLAASATDLLGNLEGDVPEEIETDSPAGQETVAATDIDKCPSSATVALSRYLNGDDMEAAIADDGQSVHVTTADESYRAGLDSGVEGDGPHRSRLEEAVERVRIATQTTND